MNILTTGLSGLVGSRIQEVLQNDCSFEDIHLNGRVEIQDSDAVKKRFEESSAKYVLHLAAKADPDECEKDREEIKKLSLSAQAGNEVIKEKNQLNISAINSDDWKGSSSAFAVNVVGTKNISESALATGKKLIYISTDYVFSGDTKNMYTEESVPDPVNYYGLTKYWGEQIVQNIYPDAIIARIAVPYGSRSTKKLDIVARMRQRFEKNEAISGIEDQLVTPTFIDDIAHSIKLLFEKNISGIVNVVGSSSISPYEIALAIAGVFNYDKHLIKAVTMKDFYINRARRPQYTVLSNDKLKNLGYTPRTFDKGIEQLNAQ